MIDINLNKTGRDKNPVDLRPWSSLMVVIED